MWQSPQFWLALPAILSVLLFGAVALAAMMRARPEDVPKVLSIFSAIFTRRAGCQPGSADQVDPLPNEGAMPSLPRPGDHRAVKQKGGKGK